MRPHVIAWLERFLPHDVAVLLAPSWFTCVGLAGLLVLLLVVRLAPRHRIEPRVAASAVFWGYLAAVAAGIAMPMLIDLVEQYVASGRVRLRWAGMTSFWGYLAGGAAIVAVCRREGVSVARFADLAAAPLGGALVLSRLGCFVAGCDFGKVTSGAFAMRFPSGSPAWHAHVGAGLVPPDRAASLPVHPTQLYEAAVGLLLVLVAVAIGRTRRGRAIAGARFLAIAAVYALARLVIEELRGDRGRGFVLGLASGQVFALLLLSAVAVALFAQVRWRRLAPQAAGVLAGLVMLLATAAVSDAQPAPAPVPPAEPPATEPAPVDPPTTQPPTEPPSPPATPPATPPAPPIVPYTPPPAGGPTTTTIAPAPARSGPPRLQVGLLVGLASPINRRSGQVGALSGPTLSFGVAINRAVSVWLDLDSLGNDDATHGTVLVGGSIHHRVGPKLELGGRAGFGSTLVNFDEPTFRDVAGPTLRAEALVTYDLAARWFVALRPVSFDLVSADELGGPILTWQVRLGVGVRFGPRLRGAP